MKHTCLCSRIVFVAAFVILQLFFGARVFSQTGPPLDQGFGSKGAAFLNLYDSLAELGMINDYVLDGSGNAYFLIPRSLSDINGLSGNDGLIVKINPAGILDSNFNGMGYAIVHNMALTSIWQQPYRWGNYLSVSQDGSKITVYGGSTGNIINTYRITKDGLPDYSYGVKGCKNIYLVSAVSTLQDVRPTADGGVLLYACRLATQDSLLYTITKVDAEGDIDPSYNGSGNATVALPGTINTPYYIGSLSLPSGGFLMGTRSGLYNQDELYDLNWVKFNDNGSVDSSYGIHGIANLHMFNYGYVSQSSSAHNILLPDNSLLTMLLYSNNIIQFKLTPTGHIDSSFGVNGMKTTSFGHSSQFIGRYTNPASLYFWTSRNLSDSAGYVAMRVKTDGSIDSSYIHTSRVSDAFYHSGYSIQFDQYAWATEQNIIGAGTYGVNGERNNGTLSVARLDQKAVIDPSYGVGGRLLFTCGASNDQLVNAYPLPDGRMVGIASDGIQERIFRVTKDGHLDKSFGNGQQLINLDKNYYQSTSVADIQVDGNKKIVIAGPSYPANGADETVLSRYSIDGELDPSFGQGGYVILNNQLSLSTRSLYTKFILEPDNKILLLYRVDNSSQSDIGVLRLNENGQPDASFGDNGWSTIDYADDRPETFTVLRDSTILVSGTYQDGSKQYLARLSSSGQLMTNLGANGFFFTVQGTSDDNVFFLDETDSGQIVYALTGRAYSNLYFTLAGRLNSDLSYDQHASLSYINGDQLSSAQLLHDGRLVLTGLHNSPSGPPRLAMTVTKNDLSIDSLFGENGFLTYPAFLPDTLTQTNPYPGFGSTQTRSNSFDEIFGFRDANGQFVIAATAEKDSLGDIFLLRHLFNDTAKGHIPAPPQAKGSIVVWTRALCPMQGFINLHLYDSAGAEVFMPNSTALLLNTLTAAPACNGSGGFTYTVLPGTYLLKAFCGTDSLVSSISVLSGDCIDKDVTFGASTTPPNDTTSTGPPNDSTRAPHQIRVFPNPTKGVIDIKLPAPDNGNILVVDMTGRAVLQVAFSGQKSIINLSSLEKGYYIVWVNGQQYTEALSVLKL